MPINEKYTAEVTVTVRLGSDSVPEVASYSVTRKASGFSAAPGEVLEDQSGVFQVTEAALMAAIAAHHFLQRGLQEAERGRLK